MWSVDGSVCGVWMVVYVECGCTLVNSSVLSMCVVLHDRLLT